MIGRRHFASDNFAGVHPEILKALEAANRGHAKAYGEDPWTARAVEKFKELFGPDIEVFFVFGGTGANVTGLQALLRPHQGVICSEMAHIATDECGAPERFTGCKLLTVPAPDGKLAPERVRPLMAALGNPHHVQPGVIALTQGTELGTVYTPAEVKALAGLARRYGLKVHMDGARIANAAVSLNVEPAAFTRDAGVDVLSFGGAKNGLMYGEAVVFFNRDLAREFPYLRKQGTQLPSKMRFVAAQFEALLSDGLWKKNATHANAMARLLADSLKGIPQVKIFQEVQANAIFAEVPRHAIPQIQEKYFFWVLDEEHSLVRWMTAFDTTEGDVEDFVRAVREAVL